MPGEVTIKVKDEKGAEVDKVFKEEDVSKLVQGSSELQGKLDVAQGASAKLKVVQEFMGKYNLDPEGLVANADGAFALVSKLIEEGVIDASGKVLVQKGGEPREPKEPKGSGDVDLDALLKGDTKGLTGDAKLAAIVAKAIEPTMRGLGKTIDEITTVQTGMLRNQWEERILKDYPNLTTDDVRKVFSEAAVKPKMGLLEIAKGVSVAKSTERESLRQEFAKEHGINLEEFDANKLGEKGNAGGAAVMFQGKGFTLSKRRVGKDLIDPAKATREYFKKAGIIR
uniref:Uncharacterized protein n=1 Tax=viral metagenome TaxID=1070528 RepID=A0A6M3KXA6_9ZZZZ